jgi:hypothetical protein
VSDLEITKKDYDNMEKQFPVYDALYAFAKADNKKVFDFKALTKKTLVMCILNRKN